MKYRRLIIIVILPLIVMLIFFVNKKTQKPKIASKVVVSGTTSTKPDSASIFEYTDESGNLVITNKQHIKARKMKLAPLVVYANPMTKNDLYANGDTDIPKIWYPNNSKISNLGKFTPNINENMNEYGRNFVLNEELAHEKDALNSALKLLANAKENKLITEDNTQYINRLQTLQDNIEEHKKNIELLTRILNK